MAVVIAATALAGAPAYQIVVTHEDGHVMWRVPVRLGASIVFAYTNSIYAAPTEETLRITPDGFVVTEVRSTSEAVLSYNALPPPYRRQGSYVVATTRTALSASLPVRIGQTGRQRLIVDGTTLPLFVAGTGTRVTVEIDRVPAAVQWTEWR